MAMTTPKGFDQSTKNDPKTIRIDPRTLVLDNIFRGRWAPDGGTPTDPGYLRELAMSMILQGQQQPIIIRQVSGRGDDRQYAPVFGFNRTEAAVLIMEDEALRALAEEHGRINKNGVFLLDAVVRTMNKEEAIIHNIAENKIRKATSPIDDAHNLVKLRDMGWTNNDAARVLGMLPQNASVLIPLVQLEDRFQLKVHTGELTVKSALNLLSLPEEERDAVFSEVEAEIEAETQAEALSQEEATADTDNDASAELTTGEATTSDADEDTAEATAEKPKAKAKKKVAKAATKRNQKEKISDKIKTKQREQGIRVKPTIKELRMLLLEQLDENINHGEEDASIRHLFQTLLEYINGDADADNTITALVDLMSN